MLAITTYKAPSLFCATTLLLALGLTGCGKSNQDTATTPNQAQSTCRHDATNWQ